MAGEKDIPLRPLPAREPDSHKGTFGTALIVGGSRGMTGAAALAAMAALRGGAGLVRVAVPDPCLETVAQFEPAYTTLPMPADAAGRFARDAFDPIAKQAAQATVTAIGPGLGRSAALDELVRRAYMTLPGPLIVDADGLNALAAASEGLECLASPGGPRILTPHPGEFGRLVGEKADSQKQASQAVELAARCGVVVVLKGHRTLVTDGRTTTRNTTGNPGMASGGSGDVLTGLTCSLWAQGVGAGWTPFEVARLAVYLHGLAGDLAAESLGQISLIADDLIRFLPEAFRRFG